MTFEEALEKAKEDPQLIIYPTCDPTELVAWGGCCDPVLRKVHASVGNLAETGLPAELSQKMIDSTWELHSYSKGRSVVEEEEDAEDSCFNCGEELSESWGYCPYCGEER